MNNPNTKNITINSIMVEGLSSWDFIGFAFDCYIVDEREWDFHKAHRFFEESVLKYPNTGVSKYSYILKNKLVNLFMSHVSSIMSSKWDDLMTHFKMSVHQWTIDDMMVFDEYRSSIIEHVDNFIDIDYSWGLNTDEDCGCDETPEINNENQINN